MILLVDVVSGHYTIPGPTASGSGGVVPSYPIAPPSTIRGFLESFCGESFNSFLKTEFRYGFTRAPEGRGQLLRKYAVWSSSGVSELLLRKDGVEKWVGESSFEESASSKEENAQRKAEGLKKNPPKDSEGWERVRSVESGEMFRPLHAEMLIGLQYWVEVTDESTIRKLERALVGEAPRWGNLYLGESSDLVSSVREVPEVPPGASCVTPGTQLVMPWVSGRGFGNYNAQLCSWDIVKL